jgi:SAM-dependent methyltransferase
MTILPPGTILQLMHLRERLKLISPGRFYEIGPGAGDITSLLISMGWQGVCFDLNADTIDKLEQRFKEQVDSCVLSFKNEDFLDTNTNLPRDADLVISCMVMEHMNDDDQQVFLKRSFEALNGEGLLIGLVPSSPSHWGIEDDIAGHYRRYTRESLNRLFSSSSINLDYITGLTFPVSNVLLPVSNFLVNRAEANKKSLSMKEKTKLSGNRAVLFKTRFPFLAGLLLNRVVMTPFHWLQKLFSKSSSSLVLYFEAKPKA